MMSVVAGFIAGYILAIKNGRLDFDEISQAWGKIKASEEVQDFVTGGRMMLGQVLRQGIKELAGQMNGKK